MTTDSGHKRVSFSTGERKFPPLPTSPFLLFFLLLFPSSSLFFHDCMHRISRLLYPSPSSPALSSFHFCIIYLDGEREEKGEREEERRGVPPRGEREREAGSSIHAPSDPRNVVLLGGGGKKKGSPHRLLCCAVCVCVCVY